MPAKNRVDVHHEHTGHCPERDDFHALEQRLDFGCGICLDCAHDDVLSSLVPASSLIKHPERLADASGVPEKDLQPATLPVLFLGLYLAEKAFWIWAGECARHDARARLIV